VFTIADDRLSKILLLLHKKGSRVRIISDNDCAKNEGSDVIQLARAGIPTKLDVTEFHMHHKFAVLRQRGPDGKDAKLLITGSYNWTRSASTRNEGSPPVPSPRGPRFTRAHSRAAQRTFS
jgi:phosphatidylserine/phosphatidylglycerophosphate/cardiolipin synthase-like enzyme